MDVLVTGTSGKFVTYLQSFVSKNKRDWRFSFISLRDDRWESLDYSAYDAVIHCAGITQAPNDNYEEFKRVNVDVTKELFEAFLKTSGRQFIYLSSMAVYDGIGWGFGTEGLISSNTSTIQRSNYGKSKYEAEKAIQELSRKAGKASTVAVVRAPSIVGANLEAYFDRYCAFAKMPFLPIPWTHIESKRSFVYVDTLIEFLCNLIAHSDGGLFFPHNIPQLSVSEMMLEVCIALGKRKRKSVMLGKMLPSSIQKRFFSQICYEDSLSQTENLAVSEISSYEAIQRVIKGNCL